MRRKLLFSEYNFYYYGAQEPNQTLWDFFKKNLLLSILKNSIKKTK